MTPQQYERLTELFHAALEIAPDERTAFLDQVSDGDVDVRRELESLLDSHEQGTFAEKPPDDIAAGYLAQQGDSSASLPLLAPNTRLDHYEIRSLLGKGGMGEVYLAEDMRLHRKVALKILPAAVATDEDRMRRFEQEATAAAALNHPHIAHIYEIGEAEGRHFISMEYVEGLPLSARINGRPLAVSETVQLGMQIADALDEAHSKGITHHDIKSSNIVITPRGQAKLLDFGLAKVRRSIEEENSSDATTQLKTAEGLVIGTVMYMSPEQALGQVVDHRSDIFSLGAVLYEAATGRLPFTGSTKTDVIDHIAHAQPEAISRFNYDVPTELERIVRKCLEKDKSRRYQSAR